MKSSSEKWNLHESRCKLKCDPLRSLDDNEAIQLSGKEQWGPGSRAANSFSVNGG
jgi:hypothetical protein